MEDAMLERLVLATERSAKAQEDLITLATEERDTGESIFGPPICPHCSTFNPDIGSGGVEAEGPMIEFALVAKCHNCQGQFFAVPQGWLCFAEQSEAAEEIERRVGSDNHS